MAVIRVSRETRAELRGALNTLYDARHCWGCPAARRKFGSGRGKCRCGMNILRRWIDGFLQNLEAPKKDYKETRQARYKARCPWVRFVEWARRRVKGKPGVRDRSDYSGRGIICTLTAAQAKILWERDGAAKMKRPSLDRKDPALGYTFENCRFIEFNVNARLPHDAALRAQFAAYI